MCKAESHKMRNRMDNKKFYFLNSSKDKHLIMPSKRKNQCYYSSISECSTNADYRYHQWDIHLELIFQAQ